MKLVATWWSWALVVSVLVVLGVQRVHVINHWLTTAAFFGLAILVVVSVVCRHREQGIREDSERAA